MAVAERLSPLRDRAVNVIVPFTNLRMETYRAVVAEVPDAQFVWTGASPDDYWRVLKRWWSGEDDLVIVEHDVVPPAGWAMSFALCPQNWCAYEYVMEPIVATALGATKFGMGLQQRYQGLVSGIAVRYRQWDGLDAQVIGYLHMAGEHEHVHAGRAEHLREPRRMRRSPVVRLRYIGKGDRYLNGVPAADHEPADEQAAAEALASGLYVVDEPEEEAETPKKKAKATVVAAADDTPAPDEAATPTEA